MLGVVLLALVSCGATIPMPAPAPAELARADELHRAVDSFRRSRGGSALQRHAGLDRLARQHSEFMRVNRGKFKGPSGPNLSHEGFEYRATFAQRHWGIGGFAENVAYCHRDGPGAAAALTKAWTDSTLHRQNMLGKWVVTGIGVRIDDDGTVFATQLFGSSPLAPSHQESLNRFSGRL